MTPSRSWWDPHNDGGFWLQYCVYILGWIFSFWHRKMLLKVQQVLRFPPLISFPDLLLLFDLLEALDLLLWWLLLLDDPLKDLFFSDLPYLYGPLSQPTSYWHSKSSHHSSKSSESQVEAVSMENPIQNQWRNQNLLHF